MEAEPTKAPQPDVQNVMALQALVYEMSQVHHLPADQRSTRVQQIGDDIERRARSLIEQVRVFRGVPTQDPRPPLALVSREPAPQRKPDLNARLRDTLSKFQSGFTLDELALELDVTVPNARKLLKPLELSGTVLDTQRRAGRKVIYAYIKPDRPPEAGPRNHPTKAPPEKDNPAYTEARATGMPVRIRTERADRKGRSTPGQRHKIITRDRNYERMQAAIEKRMEEQKQKAQKEPKWKRKRK